MEQYAGWKLFNLIPVYVKNIVDCKIKNAELNILYIKHMPPYFVLILLFCINGAPPVISFFFPGISSRSLDHDVKFFDGYPILGNHKTVSGFLGAIAVGGLAVYLVGFPVKDGLLIGFFSMAGDSLSSFIKRRFNLPEGTDVPFLDQFFEALLPLIYAHHVYSFSWQVSTVIFVGFSVIAFFVSLIIKKLLSPIKTDSPRLVRSSQRFREWRACHNQLSPLARYLNFENIIYYHWLMGGIFKIAGIYNKGLKNALDIQVKSISLPFENLPDAFDSFSILFISDLHIDGIDGITDRLIELVSQLKPDVCLFGGDYRMEMYGQFFKAARELRRLVKHIDTKEGIFGVLGNHDCLEITPDIEDTGICMLVNDSYLLERNKDILAIVGVDDPHYYQCADLDKALQDVPQNVFTILLSHSPEIIKEIEGKKIDLCLCGHTHGGQICLPVIGPVFKHCNVPRSFISGLWKYNNMTGYTSKGAGSSGIPLRFNCQPEVVCIKLSKYHNPDKPEL